MPSALKISGSGQNEMVVPVRPLGASPTTLILPVGLPPSRNSMTWRLPSSASTSAISRVDTAFTTETPTPCRPPETL